MNKNDDSVIKAILEWLKGMPFRRFLIIASLVALYILRN